MSRSARLGMLLATSRFITSGSTRANSASEHARSWRSSVTVAPHALVKLRGWLPPRVHPSAWPPKISHSTILQYRSHLMIEFSHLNSSFDLIVRRAIVDKTQQACSRL